MIDAPPLSAGADQETTDWPLASVPVAPVGGFGTVRGTAAGEMLLAAPAPTSFVAVTVNVYETPLERPLTVQARGPLVHVHVWPPGEAVTR